MLLVIIAFIIGIIVLISNFSIKIIWGAEGDYTGYQLRLIASYGGRGIGGQNLGSGKIIKTYNIAENDIFYESSSGGIWGLNLTSEERSDSTKIIGSVITTHFPILEIMKFEEDRVQIKIKDTTRYLSYNSKISVSSDATVSDGINYSYTIEILKRKK